MGIDIERVVILRCDVPICQAEIGPFNSVQKAVDSARGVGWYVDHLRAMARDDVELAKCRRHNPTGEEGDTWD